MPLSGADLNKPLCLVLAPTGVAAYIVNGSTIESGLGIPPSAKYTYIKGEPSRNSSLSFICGDIEYVFLDEASMVSSNTLAIINLKLQDIKGNTKFMGGVSIICTGDFGQLPPIGNQMIWTPSTIDQRPGIAPNYWNEFNIYYLTQKERSQDTEYSDICDEVRIGNCDEKVKEYLNKCVRKCSSEDDNSAYTSGESSL